MKLSALLASSAILLGLAAPAMANTIGGITVAEADWRYVVDYCDDLDGLSVSDAYNTKPSRVAELSASSIKLSSITQSDCQNAGLI